MSILNTKAKIENEFEDIETKKLWKIVMMSLRDESDVKTKSETYLNARKISNRIRNRYKDVLPYDSTRVKIPDIDASDYINANYVNLENNKYGRKYILTQGPLPGTISHFWKMVWEENSNCIVMLNKLIEKDTVKCANYFPSTENENKNHFYDDVNMNVSVVDVVTKDAYVKRIFVLENKNTQESRRIVQFQYQSWPDFGVPSSCELFLQFLWDVRANGGLDDPTKPAIVHCSAGIGRSGTFVLIDLLLLQVQEEMSSQSIDLQQTLLKLRKCRMGLIQTAEQLKFAYCSVIVGARAILNSDTDIISVHFEDKCNILDSESIESATDTADETDSDFSENSDSNSALDKAAAAVRTRRGLPPTNESDNCSIIISQTAGNNKASSAIDSSQQDIDSNHSACTMEQNRRQVRETRCLRTRKIIADIRSNMQQQALERNRILYRLGLSRIANSLTRQNRNSLIFGASAVVGVLSFVCGYVVLKYAS